MSHGGAKVSVTCIIYNPTPLKFNSVSSRENRYSAAEGVLVSNKYCFYPTIFEDFNLENKKETATTNASLT